MIFSDKMSKIDLNHSDFMLYHFRINDTASHCKLIQFDIKSFGSKRLGDLKSKDDINNNNNS